MATQQITGIVSGFDTAGIVEGLMSVQSASYNRVSEKVEAEKLKLQAYQSINSMLSDFKTAVNNLSSSSLWNAKTASSSNESSLTATASQYAAEGSYSFRTAQLATTAQYMTQGYSSATSTVINAGSTVQSGTITLESSQARVDNSVKVEELNGGKGIYRGSIRVTDASGASTLVDLSACETLQEIMDAVNSAAGVQVKAQIKQNDDGTSAGNQLEIVDISGGSGTLRIQNVGQGTTATDLGIAGASVDNADGSKSITGSNLFYMSSSTALSSLNDGQGVEEGMMCITIAGAGGSEQDVYVDLRGMSTVGEILNAVNAAVKEVAEGDSAYAAYAEGLELTLNTEKNGFAFTGAQAGLTYTVSNLWGQDEDGNVSMAKSQCVNQLGLLGTFSVENDGDSFEGKRVLGDADSPMLANLSGANSAGIGSESSRQTVSADTLDENTLLKDLNGGEGVDISSGFTIYFYEGGGDSMRTINALVDQNQLRAISTAEGATLGDLLDYVNSCLSNSGVAGLDGLELKIDSDARGVYIDGLNSAHDYGFDGSLAQSLGLNGLYEGTDADDPAVADLYSVDSLGTNGGTTMILEGTKLSELTIGGADITQQQLDDLANGLTVTFGTGQGTLQVDIDLSNITGDNTVEELYGEINYQIQQAYLASGASGNVPSLTIDWTSMGLNWRNVDLDHDFTVSGDAAAILGIDKTYTAQTFGAQSTGVNKNLNPIMTGTAETIDLASGQAISTLNGGSGLGLDGSVLTFEFDLNSSGDQAFVNITRDELVARIEAETGANAGAVELGQYLNILNTMISEKIAANSELSGTGAGITLGIGADASGITVTSAQGAADGLGIAISGDMATASSTGLAAASFTGGSTFVPPDAADIRGVSATSVEVSGLGYIVMDIGGSSVTLNTDGLDKYSTLNDLVGVLNRQLADLGYSDMSFGTSDSGTGLSFTNDSNSSVVFKYDAVSTLASDLGLAGSADAKTDTAVSAMSHLNGSSLNRNYISRATALSSLNGGAGADTGIITVTDAQGTAVNIDLAEALTIGDVIDAINGTLYNVTAAINANGDGIVIYQNNDTTSSGGECTGNISIVSADGTLTAEHLGIKGTGTGGEDGYSVLDGSMKTVIEVSATDTLTDLMNRISNAGYKTSIINDGTGSNSYRLSISASSSGAGGDFIIDTDLDFGMQQVSKGQDSMLLYGQPDSGMSPIVLKSSTNVNNQAISGLTLELNSVSEDYTTINVKADTEAVVTALQEFVQAYNDLSDLITYLDSYDYENDTKGILFGDSTIRTLMDTIDEIFSTTYNPNNLSYSDISSSSTKQTWTWADFGITFSTNNTASDGESGSYFSRMELDLDTLNDAVTNNWEELFNAMAGTRNASDSTLSGNAAAYATFNYNYVQDENGNWVLPEDSDDPNQAINGDKSTSNFGATNGIVANDTIENGENQYTVYFQSATTLDRVSIYHADSSECLSDFTVEYLNANTGQWEVIREIENNTSSSTILGFGSTTTALAVRITATGTNAEDGKFRLVDVQCLESVGLMGKLSAIVNDLTDVVDGYFTTANEEQEEKISDLEEQMEKMAERLATKEEALWKKFNAMESALGLLENQSSTLTSLIDSLSSSKSSSSS